jgi:hypothetical protein
MPLPSWPPLAWLATCIPGSDAVTVFVGPHVEVHDDWVCEGIWDAPFVDGDFDRTDLVFGSGVRLRGDSVVFVSSGTTLDRLHALEGDGSVYVSNSLPALLSVANGALDPSCIRYRQFGRSIVRGLDEYTRELPTTAGRVRLTYFHNLTWDGASLCDAPKPDVRRDFSTFDRYREFLDLSMERLSRNAATRQRVHPFEFLATLSSGYDSPTAAVLARRVGCRHAFGFDRARGGLDDSGAAIAHRLGLQYQTVETSAWRAHPRAGVPFLAAITSGGSSVPYKGAEPLLAGKVVVTGYHGDKVWDRATEALGPDIVRSDASGTDLSEYRLWVGFVNCAVPFFGVRQIKDIHDVSSSPELGPWNATSNYNRPICRRIVEEQGVPREMFGMRKKATAQPLLSAEDFLTRDMRSDYYRWVRSQRHVWSDLGLERPSPIADMRFIGRARAAVLVEQARGHGAVKRLGARIDAALSRVSAALTPAPGHAHHQFIYHWAVDRAKERYRDRRALVSST